MQQGKNKEFARIVRKTAAQAENAKPSSHRTAPAKTRKTGR
jgi:hypothetical protein